LPRAGQIAMAVEGAGDTNARVREVRFDCSWLNFALKPTDAARLD